MDPRQCFSSKEQQNGDFDTKLDRNHAFNKLLVFSIKMFQVCFSYVNFKDEPSVNIIENKYATSFKLVQAHKNVMTDLKSKI
jgi:D-alanyl-lipoteichoic acid acyltransferase DltB (MBOAT superfamily)